MYIARYFLKFSFKVASGLLRGFSLFVAGNTATTAGGQQQGLENSQPLPNPWAPGGNTPATGVTGTPAPTEGMPAAGAGTDRSGA